MADRRPVMDAEGLEGFLAAEFPQVAGRVRIDAVGPMTLKARMAVGEADLRPGGTVSGPTLFLLADVSVYLAVLAMIGPQALAVTTGASMDFLRKPAADRALVAEIRLLKLGRLLAVGEALIRSEGAEAVVARASVTYALPAPDAGARSYAV